MTKSLVRILASLILIIFLLNGCAQLRLPMIVNLNFKNQVENGFVFLADKRPSIGSIRYVNEIYWMAERDSCKAALYRVMDDVEKNSEEIQKNDTEKNLRLYRLVSSLISKMGYVDMDVHYFRNKLNKVPKSLQELLDINSKLPVEKRWKLLSVKNSYFHLQGKDGEYNLKFMSCDGFCEAVYNKKGILLTEENDPVNMGTFNYSPGMKEADAHMRFDVVPYLSWGNAQSSPQKGRIEIQKGISEAAKMYEQNKLNVLKYREEIMNP